MEQFREDLKLIRESQIRMEGDLKYHIKRSDTLEEMHNDLYKRVFELEKPVSIGTIAKVSASIVAVVVGISTLIMKFLGK